MTWPWPSRVSERARGRSRHSHFGRIAVDVEGTPRTLHPIVRDEIYRIGSEALRNAFRHAEARQIEVELRYDERQLRLRIRDDGKGMDPKFLTAEGREGHFGLHGMRERAKLIGAKLTVWTAPESGTEIELSVPATPPTCIPSPWRSWFTEKFSRSARRSGHEPRQSPIRVLSIDDRPITLAAEADVVRWHAGFQAGLPVDPRQRRWKIYRSSDNDDVTAQIPCEKSLHRGLSPEVPREESGWVLRHWGMRFPFKLAELRVGEKA